jgi:hypothetical protein
MTEKSKTEKAEVEKTTGTQVEVKKEKEAIIMQTKETKSFSFEGSSFDLDLTICENRVEEFIIENIDQPFHLPITTKIELLELYNFIRTVIDKTT